MTRRPALLLSLLLVGGCATVPAPATAPAVATSATRQRPIPYPVVPPMRFERAVEQGTRTLTGAPGPRYWQNWTDYRLRTRLLPAEKRLEGNARIVYHNHSPDTLAQLHVDLDQNLHAEGVVRNEPAEITGGVELRGVAVGGQTLAEGEPQAEGARYVVAGTRMVIIPPRPVLPGDSVPIAVDWAFRIPQAGAGGRMGYSGDDLFL